MNRKAIDSRVCLTETRRFCASILVFLVFITTWNVTVAAQETKTLSSSVDRGFSAVADIFEARCVTCHNANNAKGELSLDTRNRAMAGGESGVVIEAGKPDDSILLDYVRGPDAYMPPEKAKKEPLNKQEIAAIETWIAQGAWWPEDRQLAESHLKDRSWWSLRPLNIVEPPDVSSDEAVVKQWPRNEIDHFVLKRLLAKDLRPAPEAAKRTLIRRLYFDLIGLPPTPSAIEKFVSDNHPNAYERLVDELLDSQRYGERWARHWLDVVHYGDTHGYDKDKPRQNAWPYRDYVIRSFNADKPWSRFVREQIAGDVLYPNTRDGIEALGFISAGPWDFVGHVEVSEDKTDGKIARHLDRDDMVRTTMQSFVGLTVGCAQCHDHKFDPILQMDYYKLHAVFAALDRADRTYDLDPQTSEQRQSLTLSIAERKREIEQLRQNAANRIPKELISVDDAMSGVDGQASSKPSEALGYHSQIAQKQDVEKWVQIDLGKQIPVSRIVLRPCKDDFNDIGAGFGFPVRFKIQLSNDADFASADAAITIADETERDFTNPKLGPVAYTVNGESARYLRITATNLAPRKNDFIFALAEVEICDNEAVNRALEAKVTSLDSIESGLRWRRRNLTDGEYLSDPERLDAFRKKRQQLIADAMTDGERVRSEQARARVLADEKKLASLPPLSTIYSGTVLSGTGKFIGTGANDGKPRSIHLLERGDVTRPRQSVKAGALTVLGLEKHFVLDDSHSEADRRVALANWLTDKENPLTWRNVVNRVWQYHFGRGIVETPNDFGRMGGKPSHPELLDYLAVRFRDQGLSLKQLHRLILTSAAWRQSSRPQPTKKKLALALDADNRLLWKMERHKLEAEAVRDSVLFVSGKLDLSMHGPGYRDFVLNNPEHSPHYEYHLHDPEDSAAHRRSVYRFIVRSQLEPLMSTLDCADPSILVGRRNQSLTPLQSLTMLNNGLMVTMASHFASKLEKQHDQLSDQIRTGFQEAIGRQPTTSEHTAILGVAQKHGLANACRLIFNLNEFSFVD